MKYKTELTFQGEEVFEYESSIDSNYDHDFEDDSIRFSFADDMLIPGWNDTCGIDKAKELFKDNVDEDDIERRARNYVKGVLFHPKDISNIVDGVVTYTRKDGWECVLVPDFKSRYNPYGFFGRYSKEPLDRQQSRPITKYHPTLREIIRNSSQQEQ